mgnify:CR=1 FL=1|jgi:hypothetical protein
MNKLTILIALLLVGCTNSIYLKKDQVTDIYMTMPDTAYELLNKRLPDGSKMKTYVKQYLKYLDYYNGQYPDTWEYE